MKPELTIVIPAYNEENRLGNSISKIIKYFKEKQIEIIVVDDGSFDNTVSVASSFKNVKVLENKENIGKGYSVKQGVLAAKANFVLFSDADLSTPIEDIEKLWKYKEEYDIVIGSRKSKGAKVVEKQPPWRVFAGNIFPIIARIMTGLTIKDTQCGFKLFNMKKCRKVFEKMTIDGFSFDVEMLYIAKKQGLKIKEVGVDWYNDNASKVSLIKDSIHMFTDLIKIKIKDFLGRY
ncbi:MAG: dolichyl-phosphate beta-glucosyltransferase [Nanoarchaeota archaeon]